MFQIQLNYTSLCVYVNAIGESVINEDVRGLDYSEVSNVDTVTTNDQLDTHAEAACFEKNFVKFNRYCQ